MRLVHGEPDKGYAKAFEWRIERETVTYPLPVQFPGFLPDGVPDSLNGAERGEDGVGTAAKAGAEVPGCKGCGPAGTHQIKGCGKDSFFCDSNRSCHNRCSVSVLHKNKQRGGNVQSYLEKIPNCPHHCPYCIVFRNVRYTIFAAVNIWTNSEHMEMKFCQSCGMPLTEEMKAIGSVSAI